VDISYFFCLAKDILMISYQCMYLYSFILKKQDFSFFVRNFPLDGRQSTRTAEESRARKPAETADVLIREASPALPRDGRRFVQESQQSIFVTVFTCRCASFLGLESLFFGKM
jgi:hypothetical protein